MQQPPIDIGEGVFQVFWSNSKYILFCISHKQNLPPTNLYAFLKIYTYFSHSVMSECILHGVQILTKKQVPTNPQKIKPQLCVSDKTSCTLSLPNIKVVTAVKQYIFTIGRYVVLQDISGKICSTLLTSETYLP